MSTKLSGGLAKAYDYIATKLLQIVGGLFMEQKDEDGDGVSVWVASLGRVAFWIVFGHMMWTWQGGAEVLAGEQAAFYSLLGYQGVKLGVNGATDVAAAWKGTAP
jgi:hypothetical protein